ncbi:MAG: succinylglutamate desuccinylase/aspartoacylase family protein [Candidatus Pacebacteria bacterium]|nr:succinylglutamate desuccinylase/aspartoacylase family protein [Candidatus Paceibacterota bacterium]
MKFEERDIYLIAGLHGNERAPVRALTSASVDFVLGNPEAHSQNLRFTESDLNASFGIEHSTREGELAREILNKIPVEGLVVDFHTTSAKGPPFVILTDIRMLPFAETTGLKHAVLMSHNIKEGHALINMRDGISIEMSGYDSEESVLTTLAVLESVRNGTRNQLEVYEVYEKITKPGTYENFAEHTEGFFPVLVGEDAYDFIGLKARRLN